MAPMIPQADLHGDKIVAGLCLIKIDEMPVLGLDFDDIMDFLEDLADDQQPITLQFCPLDKVGYTKEKEAYDIAFKQDKYFEAVKAGKVKRVEKMLDRGQEIDAPDPAVRYLYMYFVP